MVGAGNIETVVGHDVLGRLMVQCLRQQGLSVVLTKLLGFDGCEFYTQEWPQLVGRTYGEVMFSFRSACPIGIEKKAGNQIFLNPAFDAVMEEGDKVRACICVCVCVCVCVVVVVREPPYTALLLTRLWPPTVPNHPIS